MIEIAQLLPRKLFDCKGNFTCFLGTCLTLLSLLILIGDILTGVAQNAEIALLFIGIITIIWGIVLIGARI